MVFQVLSGKIRENFNCDIHDACFNAITVNPNKNFVEREITIIIVFYIQLQIERTLSFTGTAFDALLFLRLD